MKQPLIIIVAILVAAFPVIGMGAAVKSQGDQGNKTTTSQKEALLNVVKMTENKIVLNPEKMDSTTLEYYKTCKTSADKSVPGKFEMYKVTSSYGAVSSDTQYAAVVKSVSLSPRVDGKFMYSENVAAGCHVRDELSYIDAKGNLLWKKTYDWQNKADLSISIDKISSDGKVIMIHMPDTSNQGMDDNELAVAYNSKGNEIIRLKFDGWEPSPSMTDNGRYISIGVNQLWPDKRKIWTVYDLAKGDSLKITQTIGQDDPPEVYNDGRILVRSEGHKKTWYTFDSHKKP